MKDFGTESLRHLLEYHPNFVGDDYVLDFNLVSQRVEVTNGIIALDMIAGHDDIDRLIYQNGVPIDDMDELFTSNLLELYP